MYLISETTKEEREAIVKESLDILKQAVMAVCPGWQKCIRTILTGKRELREINMEFNARYVKGEDMPGRERCVYGK